MHGVEEITATKAEAKAKYREYRTAIETHPHPWMRELKDAYNQLRRGHGIIDAFKAFRNAGVNDDGEPKLAIWPADGTTAYFTKEANGAGYLSLRRRDTNKRNRIVMQFPVQTFPAWKTERVTWDGGKNYFTRTERSEISCLVPVVPPALLPRTDLSNFHILWEVEKWNMEPPRDPLLLRRVSHNLFAVVARWDLTELERSVIAGRIR